MALQSNLDNEQLTEMIRVLMEENYDLGRLTRVKEVLGGYCNKSYAVWMTADGQTRRLFLRLYNPNVIESEIRFEHALLNYLRSNGFTLAAAIIPCRDNTTLINTPPPENHPGEKALWALFEFLEGENKYSWTHTDLTDNEFVSAAEILAHLHHCGHGFQKPTGADRAQPRIMEFIPTFKDTFSTYLKQAADRRCDRSFADNFDSICKALDHATAFETEFQGMPELPIHCDYHPGNLKYRDQKGVGIFDFDWSKVDYRLFDVALALVYFTSIWDDHTAELRADKFKLFLRTYNEACRRHTRIDPLTEQEQKNLIPMLGIANLYVLNWDLVDFYETPEPEDGEYCGYINHNIGLMHWIKQHEEELEVWVKNALKQ
jgi:homoserine kinase type II